jgi:hypothetical protein
MNFDEPAGWIPPEFREFIYEPMDDKMIEDIRMTTGVFERGGFRRYTVDEIKQKFSRVVGVRDTRTGKVDRGQSGVKFVSTTIRGL